MEKHQEREKNYRFHFNQLFLSDSVATRSLQFSVVIVVGILTMKKTHRQMKNYHTYTIKQTFKQMDKQKLKR